MAKQDGWAQCRVAEQAGVLSTDLRQATWHVREMGRAERQRGAIYIKPFDIGTCAYLLAVRAMHTERGELAVPDRPRSRGQDAQSGR